MRWVRSGMAAVGVGMLVAASVGLAALTLVLDWLARGGNRRDRPLHQRRTDGLPEPLRSNIASVTVGAIPAACGGATLLVTVTVGAATGSGSASVPAGGGSGDGRHRRDARRSDG